MSDRCMPRKSVAPQPTPGPPPGPSSPEPAPDTSWVETVDTGRPPRPPKRKVHNHGPEDGPGLACRESRNLLGQLRGDCMRAGDSKEGIGPGMASPGDLSRYVLVEETVTVDGVTYDQAKIRALVLERHQLADDLQRAKLELIWTFPSPRQDGTLRTAIAEHQRGLKRREEKMNRLRLENDQLLERLRRADVHLRRRTAALVRVIAATRRDLRGERF